MDIETVSLLSLTGERGEALEADVRKWFKAQDVVFSGDWIRYGYQHRCGSQQTLYCINQIIVTDPKMGNVKAPGPLLNVGMVSRYVELVDVLTPLQALESLLTSAGYVPTHRRTDYEGHWLWMGKPIDTFAAAVRELRELEACAALFQRK